ncbi:MAG: hypothetical protein ABJF23_16975 [Bryobacteraceae bacterium]
MPNKRKIMALTLLLCATLPAAISRGSFDTQIAGIRQLLAGGDFYVAGVAATRFEARSLIKEPPSLHSILI